MKRRLSTLLGLLLVASLVLAACGGGAAPAADEAAPAADDSSSEQTASTSDSSEPATPPSEFSEAPMLAEMVAAGDLPPVDERLPVDMDVVTPYGDIGKYGGTWNNMTWCTNNMCNIRMILYDPPIRWRDDYTGYEPGLAKAYEWSEDGTEVTLHFREGVKWSDGEPFTMDDLKFWWEDIATNDDFKFIQPPWWGFKSDGEPMDVEFPDDYTMVMRWDTPQWITPFILAQGFWEWEPLMKPRHYLEQFHPTYNEDADYDLLEDNILWYQNPDHPTLYAWTLESYTPGERWILVRNPYYWKVDTAGNQLPYIDRIDVELIEDEEVAALAVAQGKFDATFRGARDPLKIPLLMEQAEANDFTVDTDWVNGAGAWPCWLINQDYVGDGDDPDMDAEIRELFRSVEFRKGLSVAMDRERLIDVAWDGIGIPQQSTISPQAWHFTSEEGRKVFEEWAAADAEHDPELAMERFDAAGLTDQDGDGWRDLPSGKPFELILDLGDWGGQIVSINGTESFAKDLEAVGIKTLVNNLINQPDWSLRQKEALYMLRNCHASELDIWTYPDWIFPLRDNRAWPLQGKWRQTGGEEGEEPLADSPAARLQAIYDAGLAEPDEEKRHELVWQAIRIHIEEGPFTLGAAGDQPMPVVYKNYFKNIPDTGVLGPWAPGSPGNLHPEQFYMDQ
ncbi:ABC transporter substrate-binding protein [Chloroflexi bacterium TSY]|nr:ABC transporter substrate-binding protein [Chloroflexi bacterium TSY]